jgi:hypothetical protein
MDPKEVKSTALEFDFNTKGVKLSSFNPVRIDTIGDGSCYFHALLNAIYCKYRLRDTNKRDLVRRLRKELSEVLNKQYDKLSRGHLKEISQHVPSLSKESMLTLLDSSPSVGNEFQELVSNVLDIDIYMLELSRKDVLVMSNDREILYKNRKSVVLISTGNHYELVGITNKDGLYDVFFTPDHDFIKFINQRMAEKIKDK